MRGLGVAAAAIVACALVVFVGADLAFAAIAWLPAAQQEQLPLVETLLTLAIFGPLLAIALVGGKLTGADPLGVGRDVPEMLGVGAAVGALGVAGAVGYAWLAGGLDRGSAPAGEFGLLIWGSLVALFAAAVEEIYFRGWLQPVLARQFGLPGAILISALAFAVLHIMGGARSPTTLVNLFLGGLLFGLLAARSGGIAAAVAAHFAWNWSEGIALGLDPNPGVGSFGAIVDLDLSGAALWGGSDEGLNASLAMSLTLFAMLVPFAILLRGRLLALAPEARPAAAE
jgi:membrane protease YdiL (CAAX protease family)